MQGVILAAGKGKRLQPVTPARTKAMAPVAGKPIVARVLDLFIQNNVRNILLLISPDDLDIRPYFAEQIEKQQLPDDLTMQFVVQQERLGMAHALTLLAPYIQSDFVMSACDNLVPPDHVATLLQIHRDRATNAVLSLLEIDIAESATTGIVELHQAADGLWIRRIIEKPQPQDAPSNIASLPLYVFSHKLLDYLPNIQPSARGEYELQDAIQMLIDDVGNVTGVRTPQRWQLTNVDDLLALNHQFLATEPQSAQVLTSSIGANVQIRPPVRIDAEAIIGGCCVIGPNVYIEADCQVGANAHLTNAIVLRGSVIAPASQMINTVIMSV